MYVCRKSIDYQLEIIRKGIENSGDRMVSFTSTYYPMAFSCRFDVSRKLSINGKGICGIDFFSV